jgi:hypothetical protein
MRCGESSIKIRLSDFTGIFCTPSLERNNKGNCPCCTRYCQMKLDCRKLRRKFPGSKTTSCRLLVGHLISHFCNLEGNFCAFSDLADPPPPVGILPACRVDAKEDTPRVLLFSLSRAWFRKFSRRLRGHNSNVCGYRQCAGNITHAPVSLRLLYHAHVRQMHTAIRIPCFSHFGFCPFTC